MYLETVAVVVAVADIETCIITFFNVVIAVAAGMYLEAVAVVAVDDIEACTKTAVDVVIAVAVVMYI